MKDNFELKDLCLYLDEERNQPAPDSNSGKPGTSSQESCIGDKLSCPQCGYGPIWIVSRSEEASDLNDSSSIEHNSPSPAFAPANNAHGNSKLYNFLKNGGRITNIILLRSSIIKHFLNSLLELSSPSSMSSSSSSGSLLINAIRIDKEKGSPTLKQVPKNSITANVHMNASSPKTTFKMKKYKTTKSKTDSEGKIEKPNTSDKTGNSDINNKSLTDQMNMALDVFSMFEDAADSAAGEECNELETERAIIREMCNVVIKTLDSHNGSVVSS